MAARKQKTRSKPSKSLAEALKRENNATVVRTGTVTALRWDGTVNLRQGGQRFLAVACAMSYSDRRVGDRVQVIMHGGMPFVLGAVGGDPDTSVPELFPTQVKQFTWGYGGTTGKEIQLFINEGVNQRVGRPGSLFPEHVDDNYVQAVYSYWDGLANIMNDEADTTKTIEVFMGRDDWDEGDVGPAYLSLWAHKHDGLPSDPQAIQYKTDLDTKNIDFTLEPGEMLAIQLPDDWRDNIGIATPTTETIRGFTVRPAAAGEAPHAVDNSYAILTNITCALRIYEQ